MPERAGIAQAYQVGGGGGLVLAAAGACKAKRIAGQQAAYPLAACAVMAGVQEQGGGLGAGVPTGQGVVPVSVRSYLALDMLPAAPGQGIFRAEADTGHGGGERLPLGNNGALGPAGHQECGSSFFDIGHVIKRLDGKTIKTAGVRRRAHNGRAVAGDRRC